MGKIKNFTKYFTLWSVITKVSNVLFGLFTCVVKASGSLSVQTEESASSPSLHRSLKINSIQHQHVEIRQEQQGGGGGKGGGKKREKREKVYIFLWKETRAQIVLLRPILLWASYLGVRSQRSSVISWSIYWTHHPIPLFIADVAHLYINWCLKKCMMGDNSWDYNKYIQGCTMFNTAYVKVNTASDPI